ncbi:hypothetical protein [Psychrobacillus sp. L3]|uniref:hypothetical protein n=1 Tax=Psychrobacillus sp. L3 TaxID=3236891 RepID=UPI0036F44BC8
MKRTILLFSFLVLLGACSNSKEGINLVQILNVFEENDIKLEEVKVTGIKCFGNKLNKVKPTIYSLNDDQLYIYIFDTSEKQEERWKDFYNSTISSNLVSYKRYENENVLIFYMYGNGEPTIDIDKLLHVL